MQLLRFLRKEKKSTLSAAASLSFKYGTHRPVLQALLEVFQPHGVLELGAGTVSTPLFYDYGKKLISIETNDQWIQALAGAFPDRENFTLIHHPLANISERTRIGAISKQVKDECVKFYAGVIARNPELDLLFIDHVSGLRACTLAALFPRFDFVVYHDAEDRGYGYDLLEQHDTSSHYHFVLQTLVPHTGFLIRKSFGNRLAQFKRVLDVHAKEYFSLQYHFDLKDAAKAG